MNLEERMRYAWEAYKERWAREEEYLNNLSEQKKVGTEKESNFLESPKQNLREFHCTVSSFLNLQLLDIFTTYLSCSHFLNCCLGKGIRDSLWSI